MQIQFYRHLYHTKIIISSCVSKTSYSKIPPTIGGVRSMPWSRDQMGTFSALLAICAGNSPVTGEFPAQRPVTRSFDVFFDLCLNKRLSKQSWGWWFETPSLSLWRHCNGEEDSNPYEIWLALQLTGRLPNRQVTWTCWHQSCAFKT